MHRQIIYPAQIPFETDLLNTNRNTMIGLGLLAQDLLGSSTVVSGLPCTPTAPASLAVLIGAGRLYSLQNVDNTAYSSLPADTTDQILKQGILFSPMTLACPAPVTTGFSVNYLIEAIYQDADTANTVLPYFNSANPQQTFSGPGGLGAAQPTQRQSQIILAAKPGIAATTGTQATPAPDAGYVGLYVVTVANGQATVTSANISTYPGAPFLVNNKPTPAEALAGVSPTNYIYPQGYVERYGADPTGVADSGVAFRAACAVCLAAGGGKIYALGALYNFTTWDTSSFYGANNLALFCLPGNTELVGGGMFFTKLRVSSTARAGMYASGTNRTHVIGMRTGQAGQYIHDVEFDFNGIVQQSSTDDCYFVRTMSGGVILERTYAVQAPISNGFADSSPQSVTTGIRNILRNNWWQDCGPNMTGNSTLNADCSLVYIQAPYSIVENNLFFNSAIANHNCGGIEMHSIAYTARGNVLKNLWPAMYLGVQDGVTVSVGSVVESNYVGYNNAGFFIVDQHNGLKITKNYFEANIDSAGSGFGFGFGDISGPLNGTTGANSAGTQTALSIIDNTFNSTLYRQGTAVSSAGVASNGVNNINIGTLQGAQISHNRFLAATPGALQISGSITGPTADVSITENEFLNTIDIATGSVGYIQVFAASAAGWGAGPVMEDIFIRNNKFLRSRSLGITNAVPLVGTGGGSFTATFTNVRFDNNDVVNIPPAPILLTASVAYTPGNSSGTFEITGNGFSGTVEGTAEYQIVGGMGFLTIPNTITGTSNATTFSVSGIPAVMNPTNVAVWDSIPLVNNGAISMGLWSNALGNTGVITFYNGMSQTAASWTATGTKGLIGSVTLKYPLV